MAGSLSTAGLVWLAIQILAVLVKATFGCEALAVGWCSLTIRTTLPNRHTNKVSGRVRSRLRQLYGFGIVAGVLLAILLVGLLLKEAVKSWNWAGSVPGRHEKSPESWGLKVAVPGITVPWSHATYLWTAIAVSIAVHEMGHALAATAEGVGIDYVACFVIFFMPGALVGLDTQTLEVLNPIRLLKIVCAGVLHNVLLCIFCYAAASLIPLLLWSLSTGGSGAIVRMMQPGSPFEGHLQPGDVVTRVNACPIQSSSDLRACMTNFPDLPSPTESWMLPALNATVQSQLTGKHFNFSGSGYCIPDMQPRVGISCEQSSECGPGELCFQTLTSQTRSDKGLQSLGRVLLSEDKSSDDSLGRFPHGKMQGASEESQPVLLHSLAEELPSQAAGMCLNARQTVAMPFCSIPAMQRDGHRYCPRNHTCHMPNLQSNEELFKVCFSTKKFRGMRRSAQSLDDGGLSANFRQGSPGSASTPNESCPTYIVYIGSRNSFLQALEVSDHESDLGWRFSMFLLAIIRLLDYIFAVSAAIALLNMAPVYGLDGDAALKALLDLYSMRNHPLEQPAWSVAHRLIYRTILFIGTSIFVLLMIANAARLFGHDASFLHVHAAFQSTLKPSKG